MEEFLRVIRALLLIPDARARLNLKDFALSCLSLQNRSGMSLR